MNKLKRFIRKMRSGGLREIFNELIWIYKYGLRYKRQILWYTVLGVIGIGMGLCGSVATKYVIDAITDVDSGMLIPAAVFFVVMKLLQIGVNAWTDQINAKISIKVNQEIHADVYEKVMNADWESMSRYHSGDILNRIDNDVSTVADSVLGWVPDFVTETVRFFAALGIILYYDPTLAVLALLSAPLTLSVSRFLTKKLRRHNVRMREISSEVMVFNEESFQNIQVLKSFGLTERFKQKLHKLQQKYRDAKLDFNRFSIGVSSFMSLVSMAVTVACFGWGVYRLSGGFITYGTMMLFMQLTGSLSASFSALVHMVPSAVSAATAAGRVMAISELPSEDRSDDSLVDSFLEANRDAGISVVGSNLHFSYQNSETVLENVSFAAAAGETVALVAHPERYAIIWDNPDIVADWLEAGCHIQLTAGSILGKFGRRAMEAAQYLLRRDLTACVASDAHGAHLRTNFLGDVYEHLCLHYPEGYAEVLMWDNPRRICQNKPL